MVGSELPSPETPRSPPSPTTCMLELDDVTLTDEAGRTCSTTSRFDIHRGEVLGIAGVEGNGQAELVETVMGMRHADAGPHRARRRGLTALGTRRRREAGIGYIPEDRQRHGLLLDAPLWENRILGHQTAAAASRASGSTAPAPARTPSASSSEYDVRTPAHRHHRPGAVRRQPAEADRRPRDERRPGPADRLAPDPRRRRRRPGGDLGPHQRRAAPRASRCC